MAQDLFGISIALAGLSVTGEVLSAVSSNSAINAQKKAVELEAATQQVSFAQKTLNVIESTKRNIETQATAASAQGASLSSPSLKALSLDSFQQGMKTASNTQNEAQVAQVSADNELNALNAQQKSLPFATLGKSAFDLGSMGALFGWFK